MNTKKLCLLSLLTAIALIIFIVELGAADSEFSTDTRREAWTCQYYYSLCCLSPESKRNSNNFICQNFSRLCFRGQSFGNCFQSVRWTFMPCRDASDAKGN